MVLKLFKMSFEFNTHRKHLKLLFPRLVNVYELVYWHLFLKQADNIFNKFVLIIPFKKEKKVLLFKKKKPNYHIQQQ